VLVNRKGFCLLVLREACTSYVARRHTKKSPRSRDCNFLIDITFLVVFLPALMAWHLCVCVCVCVCECGVRVCVSQTAP